MREKISLNASNSFCPQPLYLYGTYKEDGMPNYGLFCWCAYCFVDNMKFVACIGEDKLTRDLIRKNGTFSATVVTENLLPDADYCGTHPGYQFDKHQLIPSEKGEKLHVPVPVDAAWTLELRVEYTLTPSSDYESEIYICSIENVIADKRLADPARTFEAKLELLNPVVTMNCKYVPVLPRSLGDWGSFQQTQK